MQKNIERGVKKMDIEETISELREVIKKEQCILNKQQSIVDDLHEKYANQMALLQTRKNCFMHLLKCLNNLEAIKSGETRVPFSMDIKTPFGEDHDILVNLLYKATNMAVDRGIILQNARNENGKTLSKIRRFVRRIMFIIKYNKPSDKSFVEYISGLTDDEIRDFRNVGEKTGAVIRIARDILIMQKEEQEK